LGLLLSALTPHRQEICGDVPLADPLNVERTPVAEQRTPGPICHIYLDVKAVVLLFVSFAYLSDTREEQRETKSDDPLVETLRPGPEAKPTSFVDR